LRAGRLARPFPDLSSHSHLSVCRFPLRLTSEAVYPTVTLILAVSQLPFSSTRELV
jgi:hypothetical protein